VRACGVGTKIRAAFLPRYVFLHGVHPVFLHGYPTPCFYTGSYPCFYTGRGSLGHRGQRPSPTYRGLRTQPGRSIPRLHSSRTVGAINALPTRAARYLLAIRGH
jgi:hypothetical protein